MAIQMYSTIASRNLIRAEQVMLKHAGNIQVIGNFGDQKVQPLRKTDTAVYRRLKPFNATAAEVPSITPSSFATSEGVTPTANTIDYTDVTVPVLHWAVLYKFSSKAELTYEDDIPADMAKLTGETLGEVAELVAYNQIKAGTTVSYCGGATRAAVSSAITLNKLRAAARTLESNRATRITTAIKPGPDFGTAPVEPGYIVFHHTDMNADIRNLTGFTKRVEYGSSMKPAHEREIGACEEFRFIPSPLFAPFLAGGAAVGVTGLKSVGASNVDVYPMIIIANDAIGHISLKGHNYSGISPTIIPSSQKNHANPAGMFGFVGADFWYNAIRLNENWMARIEAGVTDL